MKKKSNGRTVRLGELELYVEEYGAGSPLLLLHGFGGCVRTWQPFVGEWSKQHRLILVDLRGHGASTNPSHRFTHREAAGDIRAILETLGVERCSAIGLSTGAMVLLHLATSQPNLFDALVLVSATTHFPEQAKAIMRGASLRTMPPMARELYEACATRGEPQIRELLDQFHALADTDDDMNFTEAMLATITARTLVVHGEADRFFSTEIARVLARSIPNAELWLIPGGEHVPVFDRSVPFTARALRFLSTKSR